MIFSKISQLLTLLLLTSLTSFIAQLGAAQTTATPNASKEPLEIELLKPDATHKGRDIVTANMISQTSLSVPSLWWAREQFNAECPKAQSNPEKCQPVGSKLINNWIAYQDEKRIDLVVNRQPWSLLDSLEKYRFIHKFGTLARTHNYNIRLFNQQGESLATYTCNYSLSPALCKIEILDPFGRNSLPVTRPSLEGD